MIEQIFLLLLIFQIKHWVCDYPLQTPFMLKKFQREGWVFPLIYHAVVHSVSTFLIVTFYLSLSPTLTTLEVLKAGYFFMTVDFYLHAVIDRIKARPDIGGRWKADNPKFWWALGGDQMLHHLTHYVIIYFLVSIVN